MRKYKINREQEVKLPSKETIAKHKDFTNLWHEYDRYTKRPKVPIYRDRKMFFFLLLIALLALLLAQVAKEDEEKEKEEKDDQTYIEWFDDRTES